MKGDTDECRGGKGQEEWDLVMTAKVLTLGDIGPTWYYSLTVR